MAQYLRGLFRSQFRAGLNHTLEDYQSPEPAADRLADGAQRKLADANKSANEQDVHAAVGGLRRNGGHKPLGSDVAGNYGRRPRDRNVNARARTFN